MLGLFECGKPLDGRDGRIGRRVLIGRKKPDGVALGKIPAKQARRGEVFAAIESAFALLQIHEVPIPLGIVRIGAIGQRRDAGNAGIRLPGHLFAGYRGIEPKDRVLVV